jgi:hypothetical protein
MLEGAHIVFRFDKRTNHMTCWYIGTCIILHEIEPVHNTIFDMFIINAPFLTFN